METSKIAEFLEVEKMKGYEKSKVQTVVDHTNEFVCLALQAEKFSKKRLQRIISFQPAQILPKLSLVNCQYR